MKKIINHWISYKSENLKPSPFWTGRMSDFYKLKFEHFLYQFYNQIWHKIYSQNPTNELGGYDGRPNFSNIATISK